MAAYGSALTAYVGGNGDAVLHLDRDDGVTVDVPIAVFFCKPQERSDLEVQALRMCVGRTLDVGAGAGTHALQLQHVGHDVTAIDLSATAVDIMRKAGVAHAVTADVWTFEDEPYDTIILLGRSIGIAGDLAGLARLLERLKRLLNSTGRILLTSLDIAAVDDASHRAYAEANVRAGRYAGEVRFTERFANLRGPLVRWLYVDFPTLQSVALAEGLSSELVAFQEDGNYLACLTVAV
jgi:SAM-dependent methyltransferase